MLASADRLSFFRMKKTWFYDLTVASKNTIYDDSIQAEQNVFQVQLLASNSIACILQFWLSSFLSAKFHF